MPQRRSGLPLPVRLMGANMHAAMSVKLCCPSRMASRSGYEKPKGLSPGFPCVSAPPPLGLASPGIGFSNDELIQLKIVVFAPIPSASVSMARAANPGAFAITRRLYRTSCQNEVIRAPPGTCYDLEHVPAHLGCPLGNCWRTT